MVFLVVGCFILLDFGTGLLKALKQKNYNSTVMREGLYHKGAEVIWLVFGTLVDVAQSYMDLGISVKLSVAVCTYIALMECGSIMENLGAINPKLVPKPIRQYFTKLNAEGSDE